MKRLAGLLLALWFGVCSAQPTTQNLQEQQNVRHIECLAFVELVLMGQSALDSGMTQEGFDQRISLIYSGTSHARADLITFALRRGYNSIPGAYMPLIAQKAYDDCFDGMVEWKLNGK